VPQAAEAASVGPLRHVHESSFTVPPSVLAHTGTVVHRVSKAVMPESQYLLSAQMGPLTAPDSAHKHLPASFNVVPALFAHCVGAGHRKAFLSATDFGGSNTSARNDTWPLACVGTIFTYRVVIGVSSSTLNLSSVPALTWCSVIFVSKIFVSLVPASLT
jgi:hypothetical protein